MKEKFIDPELLSESLQPPCLFPRIIPLMTYRDPSISSVEQILNATCKRPLCFDKNCPFKDIVDLEE